jgi:hypothetical protein
MAHIHGNINPVSFAKRPTNSQGSSGCFTNTFQISTPTYFGIWSPFSADRECLISYSSNVPCYEHVQIMMGHNPHTPITQNIIWIAYQALTTPWGWQPYAETRRGRSLEHINKTSTTSLSICWSFCKRYYKMLRSTIKINAVCLKFPPPYK